MRLKSWPPGFRGCVVQGVALGAAHSVLLAHRGVPVTLANPWGTESIAYAWGYGLCGQLGLGRNVRESIDDIHLLFVRVVRGTIQPIVGMFFLFVIVNYRSMVDVGEDGISCYTHSIGF